jgi:signal transduction histidine kinase
MNKPPIQEEVNVPLERVAKFVRQLTHDVRNGLSATDLEAAFIEEISTDAEVLGEVRKLREMISDTAKMLRGVSLYFQPASVHPIPWEARTVMEELGKRVSTEFPEQYQAIKIENRFGNETVELDLEQTLVLVLAFLRNAVQWMKEGAEITVQGMVSNGRLLLEIREPKVDFTSDAPPETWGTEPLYSTRPGGYGLGLFYARKIAQAQGTNLEIRLDGDELVTRITLPETTAPM